MIAISMIVASAFAMACFGQTDASTKPQRQQAEEDRVAQLIETIRKEEGLKPLKRVAPSPYMAEITCSIATTGQLFAKLAHYNPEREPFQTYSTQNLGDRPAALSFLASDMEFTRKSDPQYSVIVFNDVIHPGKLVVGVARSQSKLREWWGCTSLNAGNWFEDGCTAPIKPSIAAECTEAK